MVNPAALRRSAWRTAVQSREQHTLFRLRRREGSIFTSLPHISHGIVSHSTGATPAQAVLQYFRCACARYTLNVTPHAAQLISTRPVLSKHDLEQKRPSLLLSRVLLFRRDSKNSKEPPHASHVRVSYFPGRFTPLISRAGLAALVQAGEQ